MSYNFSNFKCNNCKPNKCFILSLAKNWQNIDFPLTGGSLSKSAAVITERAENGFSEIIIKVSLNLEWISVHKSIDTIESEPIMKKFHLWQPIS